MKRDINFGLFILIVATLIAFAGFTAYYQTTFENLSVNYKQKLQELDRLSSSLLVERTKLNQTSYQLQIKQEREEDLSHKYGEVRDERDNLLRIKANLEKNLEDTRNELNAKAAELGLKQQEINKLNQDISTLNARINNLDDKIDCLKATADAQEGSC